MREILRELEEYASGRPPTADELATSQKRSILTLPGRWEAASDIASDIGWLVRFGLPDSYWDAYPARVNALNVATVTAAARATVQPDRLTWVVVGDLDLIRQPIEALDLGVVSVLDTSGRVLTER
jgi:predicted Zn-dependent peptidase